MVKNDAESQDPYAVYAIENCYISYPGPTSVCAPITARSITGCIKEDCKDFCSDEGMTCI